MRLPELSGALDTLRTRIGDPADAWCSQAESLVIELMLRWNARTTGERALAGHGGVTVPVLVDDGLPAMVKVSRPDSSRDLENEVLAAWNGHRAVRLFARDDQRHARLLQRLPGPLLTTTGDAETAMAVAGDLTAALAVTPPAGLPRIEAIAEQVAGAILDLPRLAHQPIARRDRQAAAATYLQLGRDQPDTLLHGDLQGSNVLRNSDGIWTAIDPLGLVGEPALEALTMLRDRWQQIPTGPNPNAELLRRLAAFADAANTSRDRVIAWTHARSVRAVMAGISDDHGLHAWTANQLRRHLS